MADYFLRWLETTLALVWALVAWASSQYPANPSLTGDAIYLAHKGVMRFDPHWLKVEWTALAGHSTDAPVVTN